MQEPLSNPTYGGRSYLGRAISFEYPYHRWIAAIATIAGFAAGGYALLAGETLLAALGRGFNAGAMAFIAWGLARELDPPREWSGLLAGLLGGMAALLWGPLPLAPAALYFGLLRMLLRSPGGRFTSLDNVLILAGSLGLMSYSGEFLVGVAAALAFALDARLDPDPQPGRWLFAGLAAAGTAAYLLWAGWPGLNTPDPAALAVAALALAISLLRLLRWRSADLGPDDLGEPLRYKRAAAAVLLAVVTVLASLWLGDGGLAAYAPLWAALIGAAP